MTATVTGSGTATRAPARARQPAARRGLAFPRASTTPGKVRLIRIGLVIACLGWGVLAALMVEQHASAAHDVASVSEPLSLEAQQMYQSLAGLVALTWMAVALLGGRADLLRASEHGSGPAETLAQADIAALQARGDETLNLISRTGDADFQQDFRTAQGTFSSLLTRAGQQSTASAAGSIAAARQDANSWFAVNQQAQKLDKALDYGAETRMVIGSGSGTAGTLFSRLEADLDTSIRAGQATFADSAAAGSGAFTGLEAGVAVLALIMAIGSARGLSRRLAEYR
jgi:hypothetical protein